MGSLKTHFNASPHVVIIGAGVAGSTIALRLAELGIRVTLLEQGNDVVNGPPFCHLHAGGNLYPEITDEQCVALLEQSVRTALMYRHSVYRRPTAVAFPQSDPRSPEDALSRLQRLQGAYRRMVSDYPGCAVLGDPADYFRCYSLADMQSLAKRPLSRGVGRLDDWMIPVAKAVDLSLLKFPVFLVQEYGLSAIRVAATTQLALAELPSCQLLTQHQVIDIDQNSASPWQLTVVDHDNGQIRVLNADYVVNACGYRSGIIDDLLGLRTQRWLEFKAAYLAHWAECEGAWPELVIHGQRGTPQGMAQVTPYGDGLCQLHGMSKAITLFDDGLVPSTPDSAQPRLPDHLRHKLQYSWPTEEVNSRTKEAIAHMARYIPAFAQARVGGAPMFGVQQIPGVDPSLRTADVSFALPGYARVEIVKASSALASSDAIIQDLIRCHLLPTPFADLPRYRCMPVTDKVASAAIEALAEQLAHRRGYPVGLTRQCDYKRASNVSMT